MFRFKFTLLVLLGFTFYLNAQKVSASLNDYKYVIVPVKYDFLKEADKFQLNSLTKFLFEKYGFTAYMENDVLPDDYKNNNCLAMKSDVIYDGGFFKTKLMVQLKNCEGDVLYTTKMGETREKEFKAAYHLALRDAFTSFKSVNYKYVPNQKSKTQEIAENTVVSDSTKTEIEKLKAEIQELKSENPKQEDATQPVVVVTNSDDNLTKNPKVEAPAVIVSKPESSTEVLYAQATDDGYQLVDSTPKIVYKLKKTGSDSMFLVESINGVLTKKGENWVLEYYENGNLKQKMLKIKF